MSETEYLTGTLCCLYLSTAPFADSVLVHQFPPSLSCKKTKRGAHFLVKELGSGFSSPDVGVRWGHRVDCVG